MVGRGQESGRQFYLSEERAWSPVSNFKYSNPFSTRGIAVLHLFPALLYDVRNDIASRTQMPSIPHHPENPQALAEMVHQPLDSLRITIQRINDGLTTYPKPITNGFIKKQINCLKTRINYKAYRYPPRLDPSARHQIQRIHIYMDVFKMQASQFR